MNNFNYQILHLEQHKNFAFKHSNDYSFAKQTIFVPIVLAEIHKVAIELPMFFVANENNATNNETNAENTENVDNKNYTLIALLSLQNNLNIMINKAGKWNGQYVPATLRSFPFALATISQKDNDDNIKNSLTLCIEKSYLIPPELVETNANFKQNIIFDENKNLNEQITKILDFLQQTEISKQQTKNVIEILKKHNLIIPYTNNNPALKLNDLFCIDEKRFNELSAEALKELQNCGGLYLCYSQIVSMNNIDKLLYLLKILSTQEQMQLQSQQNKQAANINTNTNTNTNTNINTEDFFKGDTINFEGLF